jgi:hypothetical protein
MANHTTPYTFWSTVRDRIIALTVIVLVSYISYTFLLMWIEWAVR